MKKHAEARAGAGARALVDVREDIDELDLALVGLLADRMALAREAAQWKGARGLPSTDLRREAAVVRRAAVAARHNGLEPEIVRSIFWDLLRLSEWARSEAGSGAAAT